MRLGVSHHPWRICAVWPYLHSLNLADSRNNSAKGLILECSERAGLYMQGSFCRAETSMLSPPLINLPNTHRQAFSSSNRMSRCFPSFGCTFNTVSLLPNMDGRLSRSVFRRGN